MVGCRVGLVTEVWPLVSAAHRAVVEVIGSHMLRWASNQLLWEPEAAREDPGFGKWIIRIEAFTFLRRRRPAAARALLTMGISGLQHRRA